MRECLDDIAGVPVREMELQLPCHRTIITDADRQQMEAPAGVSEPVTRSTAVRIFAISATPRAPAVPSCGRTCGITSGRLVSGIAEAASASPAASHPWLTCQCRSVHGAGAGGINALGRPSDPVRLVR